MIKNYSEQGSINNFGSVQYDRGQKYMSEKDKDQALENLGLDSNYMVKIEEVLFANLPIEDSTLRFSFGDPNYDPTKDTTVASAHNTADRAGGGTAAGYGGTWTKLNSLYANVWDYTFEGNTLLNEFDNGNFSYNNLNATRFWNDVEKNPIKIINSNTSNCTKFKRLFQGIWALTEVWKLDTSSATDVALMFSYCKNLRKIPKYLDFSKVNGGSASGCVGIFQWSNIEEIDTIVWPSADDGYTNSFQNFCTGSVNLKRFKTPIDVSTTTNLSGAFGGCVSLCELTLENTGSVTNMTSAFSACKSLPMSTFENLDTSSATNVSALFFGYFGQQSSNVTIFTVYTDMENITYIPSNLNLSSASTVRNMFNSCKNLKFIDSTVFETLKNGANISQLFFDCPEVEAGMVATYNVLKNKSTSNHSDTFTNCGTNTEAGRVERKYIPASWGGDGEG